MESLPSASNTLINSLKSSLEQVYLGFLHFFRLEMLNMAAPACFVALFSGIVFDKYDDSVPGSAFCRARAEGSKP